MDGEFCVLVHGCLIFYEVADKLVDFFVVGEYGNGRVTNDPKDSVDDALMAFFVIGLHVTILRVGLYLWRIQLYRTGDDSRDETHNAINLWMSSAKVLLEAFPQSTIAKFYFGTCAPTGSNDSLVKAFDAFSIIAFILFLCYFVYCYCLQSEGANRATTVIMVITFLFSVVGMIFAGISLNDFTEHCWPHN
ncbi:uncharacterized protein LOC144643353 [Oculina patagonica]